MRQGNHLIRLHGVCQQIALKSIAAETGQDLLLLGGLHAFGYNPKIKRLSQGNDGRDDCRILSAASRVMYKAAILSSVAGKRLRYSRLE